MQNFLAPVFCFPNKFELLSMSVCINKKKFLRQLNAQKANAYVNKAREMISKTHISKDGRSDYVQIQLAQAITAVQYLLKGHFLDFSSIKH